MNFLQLAQAVKRESGLSGGGPASVVTATGDDARIFQWVNWAWRDIALLHESWLFRRGAALGETTTMAVPHDLAAPGFALADFGSWKAQSSDYRVSAYRTADGAQAERPLSYLDWDVFRARFVAGAHAPGALAFWSTDPSGQLMVAPTPDAAHMVRADYIRDAVAMTADADVPSMPARFHDLIVWRALAEYGGFDAAGEVFQRASGNYSSGLSALHQAQLPRRTFAARPLA